MTEPDPDLPLVLVATTNAGKLHEYQDLLAGLAARVVGLADVGIDLDVEEVGASFAEIVRGKVAAYQALAQARGMHAWVLSDDSGLEVDALDGAPGIYSTRWAGPNTTAAERTARLLARLEGVPLDARTARFRCVTLVRGPDGQEIMGDGTLEGRITFAPRQQPGRGFGYDPIFELPARGLTLAEIPLAEKQAISHRGIAARQVRARLEQILKR